MKRLMLMLCLMFLLIPMTLLAQVPANLTFNWEQVISDDFKGWRLYHSYDSENWVEVANIAYNGIELVTYEYQHRLNDTSTNPNHYFMMKAEDTNENLSDPSNIVLYEYTEDDTTPPGAPKSFTIKVVVKVVIQ